VLNSPQQRGQRNTSVAFNPIDIYLFIDFTNCFISTSVSVNVPQLGVHSVTIRTILVLRIESRFPILTAYIIASHCKTNR
jgi:hypothetical protein